MSEKKTIVCSRTSSPRGELVVPRFENSPSAAVSGKNFAIGWLVVSAIFLALLSPQLATFGMFQDGVYYATIARNLADGLGSFWSPHFSQTQFASFHEHPPLALWLESLLFRAFGDCFWVEKFYSLAMTLLIGMLIVKIWQNITGDLRSAWLPLTVWISFRTVRGSALDNFLEHTMSVFLCAATLLYWLAVRKQRRALVAAAGVALFLGLFSKGLPALFPLTLPLWVWLFMRKISFKQMLADTLTMTVCALLPLALLLALSADARNFFAVYADTQLWLSLTGSRAVAASRFYLAEKFFSRALPQLAIWALTMTLARKKKEFFGAFKNESAVMLGLALSGTLPLLVSPKQYLHYLLPVWPFLALAVALPLQPAAKILSEKILAAPRALKALRWMTCALLALTLAVAASRYKKIGRDSEALTVVLACKNFLPDGVTVDVEPSLLRDWQWQGYFARYKNISLSPASPPMREFYLSKQTASRPLGYELLLTVSGCALWKKSTLLTAGWNQ